MERAGAWTEASTAIVTLRREIPDGESREFPVAFSGKLMWRIPGISLDRKQSERSCSCFGKLTSGTSTGAYHIRPYCDDSFSSEEGKGKLKFLKNMAV